MVTETLSWKMVTPRTILTVLVGLATTTVETPRVPPSQRQLYIIYAYVHRIYRQAHCSRQCGLIQSHTNIVFTPAQFMQPWHKLYTYVYMYVCYSVSHQLTPHHPDDPRVCPQQLVLYRCRASKCKPCAFNDRQT